MRGALSVQALLVENEVSSQGWGVRHQEVAPRAAGFLGEEEGGR